MCRYPQVLVEPVAIFLVEQAFHHSLGIAVGMAGACGGANYEGLHVLELEYISVNPL